MWTSLRAELLVLRKRRAAWALVLLPPVVMLLSDYVVPYVLYRTVTADEYADLGSPAQLLPNIEPSQFVVQAANFLGGLAPVAFLALGALLAGSDWDRGTIKTALLQGPSRMRNFAGQLVALLAALTVSVALTFALAAAAGATVAATTAAPAPTPFPAALIVVRAVAAGLLIATTFAAAGLALGTLLRSVSAAVAAAALWTLLALPVLQTLGYQVKGALYPLTYALPDAGAEILGSYFGDRSAGGTNSIYLPVQPRFLVAILAGWVVVFLAVTAAVLHRRDVTADGARASRRPRDRHNRTPETAETVPAEACADRAGDSATRPERPGGVLSALRAELLILARWRAAKVFVLITPAYALLTGYLIQYLLFTTATTGTFADLSADQILTTMLPAQFVSVALNNFGTNAGIDSTIPFLLLGALVAGSDWGRGTIKTALLQGPGRARTVLGQALAILLALTATVLVTFALCAVASVLIAVTQTGSLSPTSGPFPAVSVVAQGIGAAMLVALAYGAAGLALGAALRDAGAALAVVLLWTVVVTPTVDVLGVQFHGVLYALYRALLDANALALTHIFGSVGPENPVVRVAPGTAAAVIIFYAAAFLTIPTLLIRGRNIT